MTRQGANEYWEFKKPNFYHLITLLERSILPARFKLNKNTVKRNSWLYYGLYSIVFFVAARADTDIFEATFKPASASAPNQVLRYFQHVESVLQTLCEDRNWKETGQMKDYDKRMLDSVTELCTHPSFCLMVLEQTTLLKTMATFLGNCKNPSAGACEELLCMIEFFICFAHGTPPGLSYDDIFKDFVKTGLLGQALRCFAYPAQSRPGFLEGSVSVLDDLLKAPSIVRKDLPQWTLTSRHGSTFSFKCRGISSFNAPL